MSSIQFSSKSSSVRVSGRERAAMGILCNDFRKAQTGDFRWNDLSWLLKVAKPGHYLYTDAAKLISSTNDSERADLTYRLAQDLDTFLHVGYGEDVLSIDGTGVDLFELALNSAIAWGNPAVWLAAKLHGQCELHAFCEGPDRAWLADLIQQALDCGVFRPEPMGYDGWPKVIEFLRFSDSEPVVTSYSVSDSFPNVSHAPKGALPLDEHGEPDDDAWYEIDHATQWGWGVAAIRQQPGLKICPQLVGTMFGSGMTGRTFIDKVRQLTVPEQTR